MQFESLSNKYAFDLMLLNLEFLQKELMSTSEKLHELEGQLKTALSEVTKIHDKTIVFFK